MVDIEVGLSADLLDAASRASQPPFGLCESSWAEVRRLPREFAPYTREKLANVTSNGAGSPSGPGNPAFLRLHFELQDGRTCLTESFSSGQQIVQQLDGFHADFDDMAVVSIQNVKAGFVSGDRLRVEISVGDGARAVITTEAASTVFEMEHGYASQRIDVSVGKDAYAEVRVDPIIPSAGSRLYNEVNLTVDPTGVLIYSEHLSPGSAVDGESWQFDCLYSRLRCHGLNGVLIATDVNVLTPRSNPVTTSGSFGEYLDMAVVFVIAEAHGASTISEAMHQSIVGVDDVTGAASVLPSGVGAYARILGSSVCEIEGAKELCWLAARGEVLGVSETLLNRAEYQFDGGEHRR